MKEGQTMQWPKGQTTIYTTLTQKTKDLATRNPLKTREELR
jgi:hypothetical protein